MKKILFALPLLVVFSAFNACGPTRGSRNGKGDAPPTPPPAGEVPVDTQEKRESDQQRLKEANGPVAELVVFETTDLHVNMENFDYYKNQTTNSLGFVRTAALIRKKRAEVKNSVLVDNGDLVQGNPLGDYLYQERDRRDGQLHSVYKAMNLVQYDAGNLGNHEFNFGIDYLTKTIAGAAFPYISANVYVDDGDGEPANDKHFVKPYVIKEHAIKTESGEVEIIRVGYIGFTPPQIMVWDRSNLTGKLRAADIFDTAMKFVPEMKANGADVILAVPHSGINGGDRKGNDENAVSYLTQVPGIDAVLCGHSHQVFPSETYAKIPNVDIGRGTINGVPVVMPGAWGSHLGQVTLSLKKVDGKWGVVSGTGAALDVRTEPADAIAADVRSAIASDHEATVKYLEVEVGEASQPIATYFSQLEPSMAVGVVNQAQAWYGEQFSAASGERLPVLSAFAPLKAGGRQLSYTEVAAGRLTRRNIADLYVYPNTLMILKVSGAVVKDWLEMAAGALNQIDPAKAEPQEFLNPMFPGYNFDVIYGLTYEIDLTVPSRFNKAGERINPTSQRVQNLLFQGRPVEDAEFFYVVTNNYRANGGGSFPGLDGKSIVHDSGKENAAILRDYVIQAGDITSEVNRTAAKHWRFKPILNPAGPIVYRTAPRGQDFASGLESVTAEYKSTEADGFAKFHLRWNGTVRDGDGINPGDGRSPLP